MDTTTLERLITDAIPGATAEAADPANSGDHFEVTVMSESFEGVSPVEQHRMVYAALGGAMSEEIHALTIRTMTPAQAGGIEED